MTLSRRILLAIGLTILLWGILSDPYAFRNSASDFSGPAPFWRTLLVLLDAALAVWFAWLAWSGLIRRAIIALCIEAVLNLSLVGLEVRRDGITRFTGGFAGVLFVNEYLVLIALRFVI